MRVYLMAGDPLEDWNSLPARDQSLNGVLEPSGALTHDMYSCQQMPWP